MSATGFYYDESTDTFHPWAFVWTVVGIVVLAGIITFASWGIGIWTAPWAGRANLHRQLNTPTNIRFETNHFYDLDATIKADSANIRTFAAAAKAYEASHPAGTPDPFGQIASTESQNDANVTGNQVLCQQAVQQYNNDAKNFTKAPFLQNNLPPQEDPAQCNAS